MSHSYSVAIRLVPKVHWDQVQDGRDVGKILNTCSSNHSSRFPDGLPEVFEAYSWFTNVFFSPKNSTGLLLSQLAEAGAQEAAESGEDGIPDSP